MTTVNYTIIQFNFIFEHPKIIKHETYLFFSAWTLFIYRSN